LESSSGAGGLGGAADGGAGGSAGSPSGGAGGGGAGGAACVSGLAQPSEACTACQDANCCITASAAAEAPGEWTNSGAKVCREANCAEVCGAAEPECGGIVPSPASCTDDLYAACCAEVSACATNDQCVAIIYLCIDDQGCLPGQQPCWDECLALYAEGAPIFETLNDCFGTVTCS
jgi:hypothetical protein